VSGGSALVRPLTPHFAPRLPERHTCLSRDGGKTWDYANEILIRDDAPNGDLGYPASVQMDDETVLTIYYQIDKPGEKTCLMGTMWKVPK